MSNTSFQVEIIGGTAQLSNDSNCDVMVTLGDGRRFVGTFFTLTNIRTLMARYRGTGECARGSYFWASDMIIVDELSEETIRATVQDLIEEGELESAFSVA